MTEKKKRHCKINAKMYYHWKWKSLQSVQRISAVYKYITREHSDRSAYTRHMCNIISNVIK